MEKKEPDLVITIDGKKHFPKEPPFITPVPTGHLRVVFETTAGIVNVFTRGKVEQFVSHERVLDEKIGPRVIIPGEG